MREHECMRAWVSEWICVSDCAWVTVREWLWVTWLSEWLSEWVTWASDVIGWVSDVSDVSVMGEWVSWASECVSASGWHQPEESRRKKLGMCSRRNSHVAFDDRLEYFQVFFVSYSNANHILIYWTKICERFCFAFSNFFQLLP